MQDSIATDSLLVDTWTLIHSYYRAIRSNSYGRIALDYIKKSYQNDPYRLLIELLLLLVLLWYYTKNRRNKEVNQPIVLNDSEIDELIDDWAPEDLVPEEGSDDEYITPDTPVIISQPGLRVKVASDPTREKLNLASFDFLGLCNRESIKEKAIEALRKYGVGTCGPRGFYGTIGRWVG
jgi:serine palmitoyltransferase